MQALACTWSAAPAPAVQRLAPRSAGFLPYTRSWLRCSRNETICLAGAAAPCLGRKVGATTTPMRRRRISPVDTCAICPPSSTGINVSLCVVPSVIDPWPEAWLVAVFIAASEYKAVNDHCATADGCTGKTRAPATARRRTKEEAVLEVLEI